MAYKYLVWPRMKRYLCRTPGGEIWLRCGGRVTDDPVSRVRRRYAGCILISVALLTVAGCELGPDFHPPVAPQAAGYAPGAMVTVTASAPVAEGSPQRLLAGRDIAGNWWTSFGSRQLDAFVEQALVANPNLQAAQAALRQAKETAFATEGALLPQIDANASGQRQQFSEASVGVQGPPLIFNLLQTTLNVSYSLDVFGGKRRQLEASEAQAEYQRFQLEATYLTLTANLVATAIQVASLHGQIEATRDIVRSKRRQLGLMQGQFEVGTINKTDVLAQESDLLQTEATLPGLEKQMAQQRHVLVALMGRFPNQDRGEVLTLSGLRLPSKLPVSLPSQLVEQRPDIRAAEAQVHQTSAEIGVAVANLLPQLTLTADYGSAAPTLATLFTTNTMIWSIAGGVAQPIFHGGTLIHQKRAAIAAYEAAYGQYCNTVLLAFQNVADVLRALHDDARTLKIQDRALRVAIESLAIARNQFSAGTISYVTLLNAQRAYEQARLALVQAQAARLADTAALFQALGGGWWNRSDVAANVAPRG
jgi:NodT family efflux transporter outer membrane factor (OMF) lipoprotein